MLEPRKKKRRPNKWTIATIPIVLVLISSILIFNGKVFSNIPDAKRYINFEGKQWDMTANPSANIEWMTKNNNISFIVNLEEDYQRSLKSDTPADGDIETTPPATIDPVADNPLKVTATQGENGLSPSVTPIIEDDSFTGKYHVGIPLTADGTVTIDVDISGEWSSKPSSHSLKIIRDTLAPEVNFSGAVNGSLYTATVKVDVELIERYVVENSLKVVVKKNQGDESALSPLSAASPEKYTGVYTFNEDGEYELIVSGEDEAGNSIAKSFSFSILKNGPKLHVLNLNDSKNKVPAISNTNSIEVLVESGITIKEAVMQLTLNGEPEGSLQPLSINRRTATLTDFPIKKEGKYVLSVTVTDQHKDGKVHNPITYEFTVDHTSPELTIEGVEHQQNYKTEKEVAVTVQDTHYGTANLVVKKKDIKGNETVIPTSLKNGKGTFKAEEDGEYTVKITAEDQAGNKSEKTLVFTVDQSNPIITISENVNGRFFKEDKELTIAVEDLTLKTIDLFVTKDKENYDIGLFEIIGNLFKSQVKHTFTQEGVYVIAGSSTDSVGLINEMDPVTFTIDKTKPVVVSEVTEVEKDKKKYKEVAIDITDKNIDWKNTRLTVLKDEQEYLAITGEEVSSTHLFELDGNYVLKIVAVDKAGNTAEHEDINFTIDNTPPELFISGVEDGAYYQKLENLQLSVEDLTFLLKETTLEVLKDGEPYEVDGAWEEIRSKGKLDKAIRRLSFTEDGKYEITLTTKDFFGNTNELGPVKFTIDNTDPEFTVTSKPEDAQLKVNRTVKIKLDETNPDWEETILYVTRNGFKHDEIKGEEVVKEAGHIFSKDGNYVLQLEATDKALNKKAYKQIKFIIDKTPPHLAIDGVKNGGYYQKLENLELSIEDLTFLLKDAKLVVKKNGKPLEKLDGTWDEAYTEGGLKRAIRKLSFDQDGDYEISLTVTDLLGNDAALGPIKFTIDATVPVITFDGIDEGAFVQKGKKAKVIVNERNFDKDKVKITVTKDQEKYEGTWSNTNSLFEHTFVADGHYEVVVVAEDKAGNKATQKKLTFTVDNVKPEIKITGAKNNSYYNSGKKVKIEVEELNFKNNSVDIQVTRKIEVDGKAVRFPIGEWKNVNKVSDLSYLFDEDGEYEIIVNAMDAARNKAAEEKLLFTIDQITPELKITGVEHDHNYRTDKPVSIKVSDRNIDLSQTNLKVKKDNKEYRIGDPELKGMTSAEKQFTFKEEGSYVINLNTTDKAGNKKVHDQIAFIIDKTNPVVKIDGVNNNSFNPENKNVTISIDELNFKTNNVSIKATKDGAPFNIGNWANAGKLSKLGYNFNRDGLYTILATAEDKAGNGPVSEKKTFTIDKTNPEIEITGVENNAYYNVDKPVNVAIKDVNLDINKITVTRNGARYNAGGFSVNGNLASLRHNFSGEGEYNIVVEAIDKAGNSFSKTKKFTIDKTKPVITPKFKGQNRVIKDGEYINEVFTPEFALAEAEDMIVSATLNNGANLGKNIPVAAREMKYIYKVLARDKAGNESTLEISFTLDTTKPALNISGVLDGFFNKDITPKVTYSDIHLDRSKTSVTLNGKPFENGAKLEYEQDYILKAVVTDLANNVSSRTIVFTIDKTSPVIKFKEPISNKYFNTDLLPQLLIEDMSAYDIIAMMLDGKPYEAGDPIKEEGKHVMFFEVKDKAGNIQQLSVEFIIDKTAPKVVYKGVKNKEKYYDPVDISIRLDNPNDKIKSVMINGELFDGNVMEENGYQVIKTKLAEIKPYIIEVTAFDEAGNEKTTVISFEIVEKGALVKFYENKPLLGGTIAGLVGLVGAAATVLVRRRKVKVEEE